MHWCIHEQLMLMTAIPLIGLWFKKLHAWYHLKFNHKCHTNGCEDIHVEHKDSNDDSRSAS